MRLMACWALLFVSFSPVFAPESSRAAPPMPVQHDREIERLHFELELRFELFQFEEEEIC